MSRVTEHCEWCPFSGCDCPYQDNGGPNTADNLRLLCRPCHIAEGVN